MNRRINWVYEEIVLVADALSRNDWNYLDPKTHGNKLDRVVLDHFKEDEDGMRAYASQIRALLKSGAPVSLTFEVAAEAAIEGGIVDVGVRLRERETPSCANGS